MLLLVKFDEKGNLVFQSEKTRIKYERFKEFHMRTGEYFSLSLEQMEKKTTEKQVRLFKGFVLKVSDMTGNDFADVQKVFFSLLPEMATGERDLFGDDIVERLTLDNLNNDQFDVFLTQCVHMANDMTGMNWNIYTDEEIGTVIRLDE